MALHLGELSIALELDNARLRTGMGQAKKELEGLPPVAQRELVKVTREMDRGGRESGGKLAQGINQGLIRNSPLIVAGVSGALAAGAPVVLAGAAALFGGVGIAAAAQNDEVRAAWAGLGDFLLAEVADVAAPIVDTTTRMADKTAAAFTRIKPEIIDAVSAVTPQIDRLFQSTLRMGENALPGMVRAAEQAGPAVAGLGSLLESTGSGVSEFFSIISEHSPAAGVAFTALGDTVENLLPILGELLGQGVELASVVLPPVASALGVVADVAGDLGPLLPAIVAGFAGMKIVGSLNGMLGAASGGLAKVAQNAAFATYSVDGFAASAAGRGSQAAGRMGRAASTMGENIGKASAALPALGIVLAGVAADLSDASSETDRWASALLAGGSAAAAARKEYGENDYLLRGIDEWTGLASSIDDAEAQMKDALAAMSPLERAQALAAQAQADYTYAVSEFGETSPRAKAALEGYNAAQAEAERQAGLVELAVSGVTQAMLDQANQALAAIDSTFGYQHSLNQLEDAQAALADVQSHLNDTNADTRTSTEDVERAQLALAEQNYRTALAFGQQQADLSGLKEGTAEYDRLIQSETLAELERLRQAAGPVMAAALDVQIGRLRAAGLQVDTSAGKAAALTGQMEALGLSVTQVPSQKGVIIDAPTAEQKRRIEELGFTVRTLPDGRIYVSADTAQAEADLAFLARTRYAIVRVDEELGRTVRRGPGGLVPERAAGGPVWPGQTFLVGEEGPELVRFAGPGTVIPAEQTQRMLSQPPTAAAAPAPAADAGPRVVYQHDTIVQTVGDPRAIAAAIDARNRDREFLAGVGG